MHNSVLLQESIDLLITDKNGIYIDATFGRGGHSKAILDSLTKGRLIAFDRDKDAIEHAAENFHNDNFSIHHLSFAKIYNFLKSDFLEQISGILFDFGVSSPQFDDHERGFSFQRPGPIDMRMDKNSKLTAYDVLIKKSELELVDIFEQYGEERFAKKIAKAIKFNLKDLKTTSDLASLVFRTIGKREKKHPATRIFQALRIYVNNELYEIEKILENILDLLKVNGRMVFISFNSLEDRIIKNFMKEHNKKDLQIIVKKLKPNRCEILSNKRSRSAILRAFAKC